MHSQEKVVGIEHHLRRGRAMAAFNSLLATRLQNVNAQGSVIREHVGKFQKGQMHLSSELHALLSPLSMHEEKHLASVRDYVEFVSQLSLVLCV